MRILARLKEFLTGRISDEEVDAHDWVLCPKCSVNVMKEDLLENGCICPNCSAHIDIKELKTND